MTGKRIVVAVLAVFLAVTAAPVFAGDVLDRIVERGEIRVGMTGSQPPLNVINKSGELMGFEVDLVNVLAESMGVKATLITKPFAELLPAVRSGQVDIVVSGVTITPQRNTKVAFVGPYAVSGKSILTKSATLATAQETDEINSEKVRITALKGSTSQEFVEVLLPKTKFTATDDYAEAVQRVLDGEADAMVADIEICQISALRYPEAELVTLTEPLTIEPIGIVLPPNDPLLINLIENYLVTLDGMGLLEELQKKWYEDGSWLIQVP